MTGMNPRGRPHQADRIPYGSPTPAANGRARLTQRAPLDEDCRADDPEHDRPQGRSLLAALPGPARPPDQ
jgi:hypothetical protein